jgi:hypothetical protein
MADKKILYVISTTDYDKFSIIDGNREINIGHVNYIKRSMEEKYLQIPIIVNEKMEVIDGQHRLLAIKELGLPVFYIQKFGYGLKEVLLLNTNTRGWYYQDYLYSYLADNKEDYIIFQHFLKQYQLGFVNSLILLTNTTSSGNGKQAFKNGTFKIRDLEKAKKYASRFLKFRGYFTGYRSIMFVCALLSVFEMDGFSFEVFWDKYQRDSTRLVQCYNKVGYIALFEVIYNHNCRQTKRLSFDKLLFTEIHKTS